MDEDSYLASLLLSPTAISSSQSAFETVSASPTTAGRQSQKILPGRRLPRHPTLSSVGSPTDSDESAMVPSSGNLALTAFRNMTSAVPEGRFLRPASSASFNSSEWRRIE